MMNISTEISEELYKISPLLAGIEKKNNFSVPDDYFNALSMNIFKRITTNSGRYKTHPVSIPENYFENLDTTILNKINLQYEDAVKELRTLSPLLYSLQNENVFEAPPGYFEDFHNDIREQILAKPQAKVIEVEKTDSIWKYAAAAVLTGVIGLSSLMFFNKPQSLTGGRVIDSSISSPTLTATPFKNQQQINAGIALLTEDEIIKYLEKSGNDADNEILATGIDENELPAPTDYLLDENTLDTYLGKTEKNSQN